MKKRVFEWLTLLVATGFGLAVLEVGARLIVASQNLPTHAEIDFYAEHAKGINHLRSFNGVDDTESDPLLFLYNTILPFEGKTERLLVQGDSWALHLGHSEAFAAGLKEDGGVALGVLAAGTSSYSPRPMTLQLRRLRERFDIHPTLVLAIIDQTDVGDEGCRYAPVSVTDRNGDLVWLRYNELEDPSAFNVARRLQRYRYMKREPSKALALISDALWRKRILPIVNDGAGKFCGWAEIARYLESGSEEDPHVTSFREGFEQYVDEVFSDPAMRSLVIVTHPHLRHLDGAGESAYAGDVARLIDTALAARPASSRIRRLDFGREFDSIYAGQDPAALFVPEDLASHLIDYGGPFSERILAELRPLLAGTAQ